MKVNLMPACCGIRELSEVRGDGSAKASIKSFGGLVYDQLRVQGRMMDKFRYAIFSQAESQSSPLPRKYGEELADYIKEHKLGEIIETAGTHINPNSRNKLKVWVWTVDHMAVRKFLGYPEKDGPAVVVEPPRVEVPVVPQPDVYTPQQDTFKTWQAQVLSNNDNQLLNNWLGQTPAAINAEPAPTSKRTRKVVKNG
jgi:hypothetical protein